MNGLMAGRLLMGATEGEALRSGPPPLKI